MDSSALLADKALRVCSGSRASQELVLRRRSLDDVRRTEPSHLGFRRQSSPLRVPPPRPGPFPNTDGGGGIPIRKFALAACTGAIRRIQRVRCWLAGRWANTQRDGRPTAIFLSIDSPRRP